MKYRNLFLVCLIIGMLFFLSNLEKVENNKCNERFTKSENKRIDPPLYEKNDIRINNEIKDEQVNIMKTINPPTNYIDYTYFNNRSKRHSYNIGFEPQSPLQTERNVSFTIKP